jgi:molybdopterin molybdotransferase
MISVAAAKKILNAHCRQSESEVVELVAALGKILSEDIYAPVSLPPFTQSSVDGYAIALGDTPIASFALIQGESAAGSIAAGKLEIGESMRVFTGAPLPEGADAVLMQEHIRVEGDRIIPDGHPVMKGMHVRLCGSDIQSGERAMEKGTLVTPAVIGYLASMGMSRVPVYRSPRVTLIMTGNELQVADQPLVGGQVYESNSWALRAALWQCGVGDIEVIFVEDVLMSTVDAIDQAIPKSDMVIVSGGMSVGDYDYGVEAMRRAGVSEKFYKVKQRPGKPIYFGIREQTAVFGLPGNPSSALTTFYLYIAPCIAALQGLPNPVKEYKAKLTSAVTKPAHLTCFLKGYYHNGEVQPLSGQESYKMKSFAQSNCLIEIPEDISHCDQGTAVNVYLLPHHLQ